MDTKTVSDKSEAGTISSIFCFSEADSEKINLFDKLLNEVESNKMDTVTSCSTTCVSKVHKAEDGSIAGFSEVDGKKINPSEELLDEMENNKIDVVTVCNTPCVSKIDKEEDGSIACIMEVDGEKINPSDKLTGEVESNKMDIDIVCNTICVSKDEKAEAAEDDSEEINHFDKLPNEVIENIFSFITYHEVSRIREVCRRFNKLAKGVLNRGYFKARIHFLRSMQEIKNQLPRRESERRKHRLCKKNDILCSIEPRFNLLGMTYLKFIEGNYICFIPGKVLDELFKVIRHVMREPFIAHGSPLTRELRDLILMAIEDFDENIFPYLKYKYDPTHTQPNHYFWDGTNRSRDPLLKKSPEGWIKPVDDSLELIENKITASESKLEELMNNVSAGENKLEELANKVRANESKIEQLEDLASRIRENERKIEELESLTNRVKAGENKIKQLETLSDKVAASESKIAYLENFVNNLNDEHKASVRKIKRLQRRVSLLEKKQNKQESAAETKVVHETYNGFTVIIDPHLTGGLRNKRNDCPNRKRIEKSCPSASDDGKGNSDSGKINWKLPIKNDRDDDGDTIYDDYDSDDYYNTFKQEINKCKISCNLKPTMKKSSDISGIIVEDYDSGDYYNMFNQRIYKHKINWNWAPSNKKVKYDI